jgi:hypothetical protein
MLTSYDKKPTTFTTTALMETKRKLHAAAIAKGVHITELRNANITALNAKLEMLIGGMTLEQRKIYEDREETLKRFLDQTGDIEAYGIPEGAHADIVEGLTVTGVDLSVSVINGAASAANNANKLFKKT